MATEFTHCHIYFSDWTKESRAWKFGDYTLRKQFASEVIYLGYSKEGLANIEVKSAKETIIRTGVSSKNTKNKIIRLVNYFFWLFSVMASRYFHRSDLIIVHSLAALPLGVLYKIIYGGFVIYDAHELETERSGWGTKLKFIAKILEKSLISKVDIILVVSSSIRSWYIDNYHLSEEKIILIRNTIEEKPFVTDYDIRSFYKLGENKPIVAYCGSISETRGLTLLIDVFKNNEIDAYLVLIGDGPDLSIIQQKVLNANNIILIPHLPHDKLLGALIYCDIGVFVPTCLAKSYELSLPNKIFEYANAKLGVVLGMGPEMISFSQVYPLSVNVKADADSILTGLREMLARIHQKIEINYLPPTWESECSSLDQIFIRKLH